MILLELFAQQVGLPVVVFLQKFLRVFYAKIIAVPLRFCNLFATESKNCAAAQGIDATMRQCPSATIRPIFSRARAGIAKHRPFGYNNMICM